MSLKIWLPLDGSLENKGISDIDVVKSGSFTYEEGKIGQGISFNNNGHLVINDVTIGENLSITCWAKTNAANYSQMLWILDTEDYQLNLFLRGTGNYFYLNTGDSDKNPFQNNNGSSISTLTDNVWHHYAVTFNKETLQVLLYIDGNYIGKAKTWKSPQLTNRIVKICGGYNTNMYRWKGMINDFRLYDYCLSPLEIKQISQGLVLHYKFDSGFGGNEIILDYPAEKTLTISSDGGNVYSSYYYFSSYGQDFYKNNIFNLIKVSFDYETIEATPSGTSRVALYPQINTTMGNAHYVYPEPNETGHVEQIYRLTTGQADYTSSFRLRFRFLYAIQGAKCKISNVKIELDPNLVASFIQDSSGYNHNGTIFGNIQYKKDSGKNSQSIYIPSGNQDYIVTNQEIGNFSEGITMSIWFKSTCITPGNNYHSLFNIATGTQQYENSVYKTGYYRSGMVINGTRYVANTDNTNLLDGNWHMLTTTYDGIALKRYVDGVLKSTSNIEGIPDVTLCKFMCGHYGTNTSYYAKEAFLNDARIYVTALSQEDINKLYQINLSIDNLNKIHTFELKESNSRELLHGRKFTAWYRNHNSLISAQPNFLNGELFLNGNSKSVGSDYIQIDPTGKTYYYDIDVSINTGNQFYIGFERYDIDKTARSNQACVYVVAIKPTSDLIHKRYRGIVNLSTDGVNPCAFIALRILSGWSGTTSGVTGIATVHRLSLREVTTLQQPKLYKEGILLGDEFNEHQKASFYSNGIIEAVNYIEK